MPYVKPTKEQIQEIYDRYNNREPMCHIAKNMGIGLYIVRKYIKK